MRLRLPEDSQGLPFRVSRFAKAIRVRQGGGGVPGLFIEKWVPEQGMWDLRRSEDILWLPNVCEQS